MEKQKENKEFMLGMAFMVFITPVCAVLASCTADVVEPKTIEKKNLADYGYELAKDLDMSEEESLANHCFMARQEMGSTNKNDYAECEEVARGEMVM